MDERTEQPVLVVEDEADLRNIMTALLRHAGYKVTVASNGLEALVSMRDQRPFLVLLDLHMPVMDGHEFRRRQLLDPDLATVPVLGVTAVFDPYQIARELKVRCLKKPVRLDEMLGEVASACP